MYGRVISPFVVFAAIARKTGSLSQLPDASVPSFLQFQVCDTEDFCHQHTSVPTSDSERVTLVQRLPDHGISVEGKHDLT